MLKPAQHFNPEDLISKELILDRDAIKDILETALVDTDQFIKLASKNKAFNDSISFEYLIKWLNKASREIYNKTGRYLWTHKQAKNKFYISIPNTNSKTIDINKINFYRTQDIYDALQLIAEVERRSPDLQGRLVFNIRRTPKTKNSRRVKRTLEINGIPAVELDFKKHQNLQEPIVDVSLKLNNPIGRLWRAIKKIWKSQKTTIAMKFTIPILVLPIFIYMGYRIWKMGSINVPVSKLGIIHTTKQNNKDIDLFILPTSDVYILQYGPEFSKTKHITEQPVIIIGILNEETNTITVSDLIPYNQDIKFPTDQSITQPSIIRNLWDKSWNFFQYFK